MAEHALQFKTNLAGHGKRWRAKAKMLVDGVTFKLYAYILEAQTDAEAVDTGRLRAGWMMGIKVTEAAPEGDGPFDTPSGEQFVAEISAAPLEAKRFIYNNVHYLIYVLDGTEKMEGRPFVTVAIQKLKAGGVRGRDDKGRFV